MIWRKVVPPFIEVFNHFYRSSTESTGLKKLYLSLCFALHSKTFLSASC